MKIDMEQHSHARSIKENNILFIEATHDFDKISILNYRGEEVIKSIIDFWQLTAKDIFP